MTDDEYNLVNEIIVDKSMIRKIGENQFLKIIPQEKIVQITTIEQEKITTPIKQIYEVVINAYPNKIIVYANQNNDNKYETEWTTIDNKTINIPLSDIKAIYTSLQENNVLTVDNMLNISNSIGMVIKQHTLEEKIGAIRDTL